MVVKPEYRKVLIPLGATIAVALIGNLIGMYFNVQTLQKNVEGQQATLSKISDAVTELQKQTAIMQTEQKDMAKEQQNEHEFRAAMLDWMMRQKVK